MQPGRSHICRERLISPAANTLISPNYSFLSSVWQTEVTSVSFSPDRGLKDVLRSHASSVEPGCLLALLTSDSWWETSGRSQQQNVSLLITLIPSNATWNFNVSICNVFLPFWTRRARFTCDDSVQVQAAFTASALAFSCSETCLCCHLLHWSLLVCGPQINLTSFIKLFHL